MKFPTLIPRFKHFLHGGDYNPDQWLKYPDVIDQDFRLMPLAGCNTFSIGIFAWSALEPREGVFTFDWLDDIMDRLAAKDFRAVLATPSGAKPAWMSYGYPEIRRVTRDGRREPHVTRHNHCWTSPVYRERVEIINRKLAERYHRHPALGLWHLSNEYNGECFCDLCLAAWHQWLERKYVTLDALNDAWWTSFWSHTYSDWTQVDPRDGIVDGLALDWRRFITWQCCDFMRHESAPLKELTPGIPVTTNMMGLFPGLDYWRVAEVCDVITDDSYPCWWDPADNSHTGSYVGMVHDMHRSMKGGRPFMLMESCPSATNWQQYHRLKRPGVHRREMLQAIGHGADGTMYFQWRKGMGAHEKFHGAVVGHEGTENTRVFAEVAEVGAAHRKLEAVLGTSVKPHVALIQDWDARWALDASSGPSNCNKKYVETCHAHYRPFWEAGVPVDVIESTCSFDGYRLVIAPMLFMLKPGVAERLRAFVKQGGTLVATYLTGIVDQHDRCWRGGWPGDGLRALFGIWNEEFDGIVPADKQRLIPVKGNALKLDGEFAVVEYCERLHLEGAKALATFGDDFHAGLPALTVNRFGKGRAYYVAARTGLDFLRTFQAAVVQQAGIPPTLPHPLPAGVTAQLRTDGKSDYVFILNFTATTQQVDLGKSPFTNMLTARKAGRMLELPANGSAVLRRAAKA